MTRDDFELFAQMLAAEAEIRGAKPLSEGAMLLWWQRMQRFDIEQFERALRRHAEDAERGRFMPQPSDLIRHLEGTATDRSMLAWGKALDAASRVGAYTDVVFDDAVIHAVIEDLGGWPKFCRTETKDLNYLQHRFCEAHRAYAGREQFQFPKRLAGDRSPDDVYERRGLPPPKPAVIGDVALAREVHSLGTTGGKSKAIGIVDAIESGVKLLPAANKEAA